MATLAPAGALFPGHPWYHNRPLTSVKEFMSDHNAVIMMIILLILAAKLIGSWLAGIIN
jgi:hypothetical protein